MNQELIKQELIKKVNQKVLITVYGLRNKINRYEGTLYKIYPNIFTILMNNEEKSFSYRDLITGDIKIKYIK